MLESPKTPFLDWLGEHLQGARIFFMAWAVLFTPYDLFVTTSRPLGYTCAAFQIVCFLMQLHWFRKERRRRRATEEVLDLERLWYES